jgi:hypothetical protein
MSTVLKAGARRCDAVCHNASGTKCGCICQGKYHGCNVQTSKTEVKEEVRQIVLSKIVARIEEGLDRIANQPELDYYAT